MNDAAPTAFGSLVNIFLEPGKTLDGVRGHTGWLWYPLLIGVASSLAIFAWYYATADWTVIQQQMMDYLAGRNMTHDQLQQALNGMTRSGLIIQTCIVITIITALILLIQSLYLFLASKIGGYEVQSFGEWFSFAAWTYFPAVLGNLAFAVTFLVNGKASSAASLDVTSLNTLIFKLHFGDSWFNFLNSLHLATFWTCFLMVVGFSRWTRQSFGKSAMVTLAPYVLIYGIWAILKLV